MTRSWRDPVTCHRRGHLGRHFARGDDFGRTLVQHGDVPFVVAFDDYQAYPGLGPNVALAITGDQDNGPPDGGVVHGCVEHTPVARSADRAPQSGVVQIARDPGQVRDLVHQRVRERVLVQQGGPASLRQSSAKSGLAHARRSGDDVQGCCRSRPAAPWVVHGRRVVGGHSAAGVATVDRQAYPADHGGRVAEQEDDGSGDVVLGGPAVQRHGLQERALDLGSAPVPG